MQLLQRRKAPQSIIIHHLSLVKLCILGDLVAKITFRREAQPLFMAVSANINFFS